MSYRQMKYFQILEDYQTAYRIARADWEADPTLKWPKDSIAWLLIKMMKNSTRSCSANKFLGLLKEFNTLGIPENDKKLWGAVAWPVRDIIEDSLRVQWFTPEFGDRLFKAIWAMPFDKPTEAYSAMVKAFVKLGGLWPRLAEFIEWWGFDSFTPYDYRRYPEDGALESLAEKVFTAYLVALHREKEYREPPIAFYEGVEKLALHSQEQADKIYRILNFDKQ